MKRRSREIYNLIKNEPMLHDGDGNHVSYEWVCRQETILSIKNNRIVGFLLYEKKVNEIYFHMLFVKKKYRGEGRAKTMVGLLVNVVEDKAKFFVGYANKTSHKILKHFGFSIGNIPYREIILRR